MRDALDGQDNFRLDMVSLSVEHVTRSQTTAVDETETNVTQSQGEPSVIVTMSFRGEPESRFQVRFVVLVLHWSRAKRRSERHFLQSSKRLQRSKVES